MFSFHSTAEQVIAGSDLSGKTAVITGASGGLGLETARVLAAAGARLVLPVRDPGLVGASQHYQRLQAAAAHTALVKLDLGSLPSVRAAAAEIAAAYPRVDVLINNAGVMFTPHQKTAEGMEFQFGVNHLGHFLLTTLLLPNLAGAGPDARVVTVTSEAHRHFGQIDLTDVNFERRGYDPFQAYGQSKAANVLMTVELARRHGADGITALVTHPGTIVTTDLARYMDRGMVKKLMTMGGDTFAPENVKTVGQGAATTVWAATDRALRENNGAFLADCALAEPASCATDPVTAERLWELSERLVASQR